jgi:hypothetical protein
LAFLVIKVKAREIVCGQAKKRSFIACRVVEGKAEIAPTEGLEFNPLFLVDGKRQSRIYSGFNLYACPLPVLRALGGKPCSTRLEVPSMFVVSVVWSLPWPSYRTREALR